MNGTQGGSGKRLEIMSNSSPIWSSTGTAIMTRVSLVALAGKTSQGEEEEKKRRKEGEEGKRHLRDEFTQ